jgi:NAD(P)-dependent dehydrogenase (short-subunit alcohol dehydrogenase family)
MWFYAPVDATWTCAGGIMRQLDGVSKAAVSDHVALVNGHIGEPTTAAKIVETALSRFKSIDVLVNNAGIFFTKPFSAYTAEDFKALVSTNLEGFLYVTQLAVKQMLAQKTGGSIVTITAALARNRRQYRHNVGLKR